MNDGRPLGAPATTDPARNFDVPERKDDRSAEQWAAVLAGSLLVRPSAPQAPGLDLTAAPWQGGDTDLTPAASRVGTAAPAAETDAEPTIRSERVALRVDAADLGELGILVDRGEYGVRVEISAPNERARCALEPERARLLSVLAGNGLRVDSVTIVRAGEAGTALAQGTKAESDPDGPDGTTRSTDRKRSQKKNHFIG